MKKLIYTLSIVCLISLNTSCEQAEADRKGAPWWVTGQDYTFTPTSGSSVKWFSFTVTDDGVKGCNNTGQVWETFEGYDGSNSLSVVKVTIYYPDGGTETISMRDDGTYSYTGKTASGTAESHTGKWSEGSPC